MKQSITYKSQFRYLFLSGVLISALTFGALAIWASFAPVSSAALAPGFIRAEGYRKTIQNPDRGVVKAVLIANGAHVEQNQPLIQLDTSELITLQRARQEELLTLQLDLQRHQSVIENEVLAFDAAVIQLAEQLAMQDQVEMTQRNWQVRKQQYAHQLTTIELQQQQLQQHLAAKRTEAKNLRNQIILQKVDIDAASQLSKKDFISRSQRDKLKMAAMNLSRELQKVKADIERSKNNQQQLSEQLLQKENNRHLIAVETYQRLNSQLPAVKKELQLLAGRIERATIKAPLAGRVNQLNVNAIGSTIEPEMVLMEIIPASTPLVIEAHIKPEDIDYVNAANQVRIRLSAYNARHTPLLNADILSLSADVVTSPSGQRYYSMTVSITDEDIDRYPLPLYPGMPAEAIIDTGSRTLVDYLLGSLIKHSEFSMREI